MLISAVKLSEEIAQEELHSLLKHFKLLEIGELDELMGSKNLRPSLLKDILLRVTVCDYFNIRNEDITIGKNRYGKPYLKGFPDFYFNISHSGSWLVCAAAFCEIGLDIEAVRAIDFNIAKRFFREDEYKELLKIPAEERLDFFFDLWTLKESYIKNRGKGLALPLNSFGIKFAGNKIFLLNGENDSFYAFKQYFIEKGYKLSACLKQGNDSFPDKVKIFGWERLVENFYDITG